MLTRVNYVISHKKQTKKPSIPSPHTTEIAGLFNIIIIYNTT